MEEDYPATVVIDGRTYISFHAMRKVVIPKLREMTLVTDSSRFAIATLDYLLSMLEKETEKETGQGA